MVSHVCTDFQGGHSNIHNQVRIGCPLITAMQGETADGVNHILDANCRLNAYTKTFKKSFELPPNFEVRLID